MGQSNDKYLLGVDIVKALLNVYGIQDDSNNISNAISKWLAILLYTHDLENSEEVSAEYQELLQAKQLQHILESCLDEDVYIKAKGFPNMKLTNTRLKNRILSLLKEISINATDIDVLIAKNHFKNMPSDNEQLGFYAISIQGHTFNNTALSCLSKSEQYSLIYDLLFKVGKVFRDDCKHEGYKNGGREKFLQVQDWIKAYKNYYK